LFRAFSDDAKRSLSAAARLARQSDAPAISPALLVLAVLQGATDLERASGISSSRARLLLRERTLDPTPPPPRAVAPDEILLTFLRDVPAPADSLALLAHFHAGATPDLARLLARHKVTPALLARVRSAYGDAP
jgi:hypothetical protein